MATDLVIAGLLALPSGLTKAALGIDLDSGRIEAVKKQFTGKRTVDLGDRLVMPGAIDVHVHFRDPGATKAEDWASGTRAAALGGVTTVIDMPNTTPATLDLEALSDKFRHARRKACVDFGLWAGAKPGSSFRHLPGASGLKLFLAPTTGDVPAFPRAELPAALEAAAKAGVPVAVHAEDPERFRRAAQPPRTLEEHDRARPAEAEAAGIAAILAARNDAAQKPHLHVCHVTGVPALEALREHEGTFGLTPHHLLLDARSKLGARAKVNPPLRAPEHRAALLEALADPRAVLESDHAPHRPEEKDEAFEHAPSGVPGVDTMLPLMMARAMRDEMPVARLVDLAVTRPARVMGLATGRFEPGMPADFAVFSRRDRREVRASHSKCGWTPFAGLEAVYPSHVARRGAFVVEDGEFVGGEGVGEFVRPGLPRAPEAA